MKQNAWEWDEQDLLDLIKLRVQESLELDYKQCDALQKTDGKKTEISKDVSAFANSAGGTLVYGMKENGHLPTELDLGYDPGDISKEWLEQVINSRIQRRIDGVRVNQVHLGQTVPGKVAYVVSIPQSFRAPHQASDKRFYKRFNFESVPMEEYEIRDIARRSSAPDLRLHFEFRPGGSTISLQKSNDAYFAEVGLTGVIENEAETPAECAVIHLFVDERIRIGKVSSDVRRDTITERVACEGQEYPVQKLTTVWGTSKGFPLFAGITVQLPVDPLPIHIPVGSARFLLYYRIAAPGMAVKAEPALITVKDSVATIRS